MAADDNTSWRTQAFRQSVVSKIDEAIRESGMNTSRNSLEMENHVYLKAKTKEDYLGYVARLILHVREINTKKGAAPNMRMNPNQGMPDPINALQNLATQGTRNPMNMGAPQMQQQQITATNLLQTLNRGPPPPNRMPNQMQNQMPNQMVQMPNQVPMGQMPNQMAMGQMPRPPMSMQMPGKPIMFQRNQQNCQFPGPVPGQSPPSVQSPAGMTAPPNQIVGSPVLAPSPGGLGPMPRSVGGMVPSPGGSLNTPGQLNQSPLGMQEEQAYREKVRQLSRYIEPLRKMIARMGNEGEHVEKLSKMKKLLEILSNPQQRMPLETLKKCEVVLEKLDFKRSDGSVPPTAQLPIKEYHAFNPLLEAVSNNLQSAVINHTLHRTFGPTLEALFGPEIKLVPPLKRQKVEEPTSEIPDVLQGEIARLDQRFKVSLDPNQQPGSKSIQLTCWLDDKQLPCVPPISLTVPGDYPKASPVCHMVAHDYNATQFLSSVQNALTARIQKLPKFYSVSHLLDTWEMSVRQASAPKHIPVFPTTLLMGL